MEVRQNVEHGGFKGFTHWGHPYIAEQGFDWDMTQAGAWIGMYQINLDAQVPGPLGCNKGSLRHTPPEESMGAGHGAHAGRLEGQGKHRRIRVFGATAPYYPKALQYMGMVYTKDLYRLLMSGLVMRQATDMNRVRHRLGATATLREIEEDAVVAQADSEQETFAPRKKLEELFEATMAKLAERMQEGWIPVADGMKSVCAISPSQEGWASRRH